MSSLIIRSACLTALCLSASAASAADDGFYTVSYDGVGFDLTQIGGFGELIIKADGFGDLSYGTCAVNFTRDESGAVTEMAPLVQGNSANCPASVAFAFAQGEKGMAKITFTEGGPLAGESFDLFPVLVPVTDALKVTSPPGFDILGLTVGQSREEAEAILKAEGFTLPDGASDKSEFTDGSSQVKEIWAKGVSAVSERYPEDAVNLTWSRVFEGSAPERVEVVGRVWSIPPTAQLSVANLTKSLVAKHGPLFDGDSAGLYYDRAGQPAPKAYAPVCDESVHLQSITLESSQIGTSSEESYPAGCGARVMVRIGESFETRGLADRLNITLYNPNVAYESFWDSWSRGEGKALEERYKMQAGMTGAAPKL